MGKLIYGPSCDMIVDPFLNFILCLPFDYYHVI